VDLVEGLGQPAFRTHSEEILREMKKGRQEATVCSASITGMAPVQSS